MSQKVIIAVLGLVILLGGGVWYYQNMMGDDSGKKSTSRDKGEAKKDGVFDAIKGGVTGGAGTFADIIGAGDAQECTFSGTDPETGEYTEGEIKIDGESFSMKAETTIDGEDTTMNIIQHEKVMYMWSDDDETMPGVKIDMSMFEDMEGTEGIEKPESPIDWLKDPESDVDYNCSGWIPRASAFEPPADVEFMDMFSGLGAMFQGMMEGGFEGEADWVYRIF